ncbi:hypothetical protein JTB14_028261 [Gonioctena quinquepunctata]|nr:hypothetical protein JTB14_028261 [Gonioctena quinquepunctata]
MLKEPVNKRLRPEAPNPIFTAKEEYYKKKTELTQVIIEYIKRKANGEIRRFEKNQVILVNKGARERGEHANRMEILDLQIRNAQNNIDND